VYIVMTRMPKLRAQLRYEPVGCDDTTAELVLLQVNTRKIQHLSSLNRLLCMTLLYVEQFRWLSVVKMAGLFHSSICDWYSGNSHCYNEG
jgi:hypothetical protein